jgi:arginase
MAKIAITLARSSLGANCAGAEEGPDAILKFAGAPNQINYPGLLGTLEERGHDVRMTPTISIDGFSVARLKGWLRLKPPAYIYDEAAEKPLRNISRVAQFTRKVYDVNLASLDRGWVPVTLGVDHSLAIGSVAATATHYFKQNKRTGLIWVDAHPDANNVESTPSGNIHGMPVAISAGLGDPRLKHFMGGPGCSGANDPAIRPENIALIGIRDIDLGEQRNLEKLGITVFNRQQVRDRGMAGVMDEAMAIACRRSNDGRENAGFHLSFDFDAMAANLCPGVSTLVPDGLNMQESHTVMSRARYSRRVLALDAVEYNPSRERGISVERQKTNSCANFLIGEVFPRGPVGIRL